MLMVNMYHGKTMYQWICYWVSHLKQVFKAVSICGLWCFCKQFSINPLESISKCVILHHFLKQQFNLKCNEHNINKLNKYTAVSIKLSLFPYSFNENKKMTTSHFVFHSWINSVELHQVFLYFCYDSFKQAKKMYTML